jgi:glucose uptake protein GlcU
MLGILEGLQMWIIAALIILGYVSFYTICLIENVNALFPHTIAAIVFAIALGITRIIEIERKKLHAASKRLLKPATLET